VRRIAIWFHRSFGRDPDFSAGPFIDPPDLASQREEILGQNRHLQEAVEDAEKALAEANARASLAQERYAEAEQLLERLREERNVFREFAIEYETRLAELRARADAAGPAERSARAERMRRAGEQVELDDRETRALIDAQLRIQGWGADHEVLHWQHGARPEPGRALAIADVPTAAGLADYVLFDGLTPLAIIEAERWDSPVEEGLEEAKLHSRAWDLADYVPPTGSPWVIDGLDYEVPFVFASNGREYIARSDAGGGVLFRDLRHPMGDVRALDRWFEPEALRQLVAATTTTH
jgi:type I restriction enzyme R subunit